MSIDDRELVRKPPAFQSPRNDESSTELFFPGIPQSFPPFTEGLGNKRVATQLLKRGELRARPSVTSSSKEANATAKSPARYYARATTKASAQSACSERYGKKSRYGFFGH